MGSRHAGLIRLRLVDHPDLPGAPDDPRPHADRDREAAAKATPGPWSFGGYAGVISVPLAQDYDDWADQQEGHSLDRSACVRCDSGPCRLRHEDYERDPWVAYVPAEYGDTATGRRVHDALLIELFRTAAPVLADRVTALEGQIAATRLQAFRDAAVVFHHVAGAWRADPPSEVRTRRLFAAEEAEAVLLAWADDPSRIDGHVRKHVAGTCTCALSGDQPSEVAP